MATRLLIPVPTLGELYRHKTCSASFATYIFNASLIIKPAFFLRCGLSLVLPRLRPQPLRTFGLLLLHSFLPVVQPPVSEHKVVNLHGPAEAHRCPACVRPRVPAASAHRPEALAVVDEFAALPFALMVAPHLYARRLGGHAVAAPDTLLLVPGR